MKPWQLGNTSVRSGLRTRDALLALAHSDAQGRIRGPAGDVRFRNLLGEAGVVELGVDATASVGRKFRHALGRLGFLYPKAPPGVTQAAIGPLDTITPAGHRFIQAQSVAGQQECFLRALAGLSFDLDGQPYGECGSFSPLLHVLRVLQTLEESGDDEGFLSLTELAAYVQTTDQTASYPALRKRILAYRRARSGMANKTAFDRAAIEERRTEDGNPVLFASYYDYADMNFRYLRGTGLFTLRGRAISIAPSKRSLARQLMSSIVPALDPVVYWRHMTTGPALPTDNLTVSKQALAELAAEAKRKNVPVPAESLSVTSVADAASRRHDLEERIAVVDELEYARRQAAEWPDIARYIGALVTGRPSRARGDDAVVVIPGGEAPAYLEWSVWRAFLAINRLANAPSKARGFDVDRDFLPVRHAPGGRPDLVFEFDDYVLVVEVTLSTSGRQEATEGYAVRQHVFDVKRDYSKTKRKPVYGLFIAPSLDPNTVKTLQRGEWHDGDSEHRVDVVPLTIGQFAALFRAMFEMDMTDNVGVRRLVDGCLASRDSHQRPAAWQAAIDESVAGTIAELRRAG